MDTQDSVVASALLNAGLLSAEALDECAELAHETSQSLASAILKKKLLKYQELRGGLENFGSAKKKRGDTVAGLKVVGALGTGGLGTAYQVQHPQTKNLCVAKFIPRLLSASPVLQAALDAGVERLKLFNHPSCTRLLGAGLDAGYKFLILEYAPGRDLSASLAGQGHIPEEKLLKTAEGILLALKEVHAAGLVHGALHLRNVILGPKGTLRLTDVGLYKFLGWNDHFTQPAPMCRLYFIAPEVASSKPPTPLADIYSLGVLLYVLATGMTPFRAGMPVAYFRESLAKAPAPPNEYYPLLSTRTSWLVMRLLARNPAERPQSADEVLEAVRDTLSGTRRFVVAEDVPPAVEVKEQPYYPPARKRVRVKARQVQNVPIAVVFAAFAFIALALVGVYLLVAGTKKQPLPPATPAPQTSISSNVPEPPVTTSVSAKTPEEERARIKKPLILPKKPQEAPQKKEPPAEVESNDPAVILDALEKKAKTLLDAKRFADALKLYDEFIAKYEEGDPHYDALRLRTDVLKKVKAEIRALESEAAEAIQADDLDTVRSICKKLRELPLPEAARKADEIANKAKIENAP